MIKTSGATNIKIQKCECQIEVEVASAVYTFVTPFIYKLHGLGGSRADTTK